jgi:hypothetical protein
MVRRRIDRDHTTLPRWVTNFDPTDWSGEDDATRWRSWNETVTRYCDAENLLENDFQLWIDIRSNAREQINAIHAHSAAERPQAHQTSIEEHPFFDIRKDN